MNSRDKGARGERELANELTRLGHPCRRGQQYSGAHGDADVVGLTGIHLEVKRVERLNIDKAMEQSRDDSYAGSIKEGRYLIPVVMHRRNRCKWLVTMDLNDFIEVYEAWMQSEETHGGMALQGKK